MPGITDHDPGTGDHDQRNTQDRLEDLHRDVIPAVVDEPEAKKDRKDEESLSSDEWEFLRCLAADFNRASSAVYQELGFSESKGYRLKERLRKKRYITTVTTNLAGKRAVFLVPSPIVFEKLGIELGPGRGKAFHKYSQNRIKDDAEKGGFKAVIEDCVDGSKGPDVGVEKDGLRIAVEICVTSKPATEAENIRKNLDLGFDRVVLSFVNRQVMDKTQELAKTKYDDATLEKVRFCIVHQVVSVLEEF